MSSCGSDDEPSTDGGSTLLGGDATTAAPVLYDDAEIIDYIGFLDTGSGYAQTTLADGETCELLVLAGEESIAMYADAGDTVATNPDGTVGARSSAHRRSRAPSWSPRGWPTFPPADDKSGILSEGPTEESALAMLGLNQTIFNESSYEESCEFSHGAAYLPKSPCATNARESGQVHMKESDLWASPSSIEVEVSGDTGKVTYWWDVPASDGSPSTFKYLQHDGTRWWITGDEQTGDLGIE